MTGDSLWTTLELKLRNDWRLFVDKISEENFRGSPHFLIVYFRSPTRFS